MQLAFHQMFAVRPGHTARLLPQALWPTGAATCWSLSRLKGWTWCLSRPAPPTPPPPPSPLSLPLTWCRWKHTLRIYTGSRRISRWEGSRSLKSIRGRPAYQWGASVVDLEQQKIHLYSLKLLRYWNLSVSAASLSQPNRVDLWILEPDSQRIHIKMCLWYIHHLRVSTMTYQVRKK